MAKANSKWAFEQPAGIMITMPEKFFKEYPGGERGLWRVLHYVADIEDKYWMQTCANIPTIDVAYCYLVWGGKVQVRLNIMDYLRNHTGEFHDGGIIRVFRNKNWVRLVGPLVKAPFDIPQKGFQGFRYTKELF